ncbi:hypothetical protein NLI96_g12272 [Meripilus lineatus]|uniref:Uncharacterized protein n=1 Tax=Meripilus lineatus TaxID=2056292 RepID=A0AAD5YCK1_9APHY|nr:hypothetical protein NLI96_g12272 [Physisporinus lineatus]
MLWARISLGRRSTEFLNLIFEQCLRLTFLPRPSQRVGKVQAAPDGRSHIATIFIFVGLSTMGTTICYDRVIDTISRDEDMSRVKSNHV